MPTVSLSAHFNGRKIVLNEPYEREENTELIVTILPKRNEEGDEWAQFSLQSLERAYSDKEPEYTIS